MLRTNDHCHGGNHMLKCGSQWLYGKRSFSVTTPCARPTRDNTERLAERETLLYRLGSELHRPFSILVEPPLSCSAKTRDLFRSQVFLRTEPFTPQKKTEKEVDYFWKHPNKEFKTTTQYLTIRFPSAKMTYYGLRISELCALAPRQRVSHCRRPGHRGGRRRV